MMKIGIIGGSGLDDPKLIENYEEKEIETRYGKPSSSIACGKIAGVDVCVLARHGRKHEIPPSKVNNRANIAALKMLGVSHILATSAAGSLREEIKRGDFVILDQLIDFTRHREVTFHESFENGAEHVSLADPFSDFLRKKIILASSELGIQFHSFGTVITIEGPRFSTRAESLMFRQWGADVINMSIAPEAALAREAGIEYSAIAMSTDYDCWKEDEKPVSWEEILRIFKENSEKMKRLLVRVIEKISRNDEDFIKKKITSIPDWPKPGIIFRDITTLLKDAEGFQKVLNLLEERYKNKDIDVIAGIESRGFILASALASRLGKGLTIIRKPGKLPRETVREEYELEYGTDAVEIHKEDISYGQKVLLVDDLIATGGTVSAACSLIERLGGKVVECVFAIELEELGGREKLEENGYSVFSIVKFNESER